MNRHLKFAIAAGAALCVVEKAHAFDLPGGVEPQTRINAARYSPGRGGQTRSGLPRFPNSTEAASSSRPTGCGASSPPAKVKTRKEEDKIVNIIAGYYRRHRFFQNVQFRPERLSSQNQIAQVFPGIIGHGNQLLSLPESEKKSASCRAGRIGSVHDHRIKPLAAAVECQGGQP